MTKLQKQTKSLSSAHPELISEWDATKNGQLTDSITVGSNLKVWWICSKGHEWQAVVCSRTSGVGCPYCSGKKAIIGQNDLVTTNPELAEEWDYSRNIGLSPNNVKSGSGLKVWWICANGHEWQASIDNRSKGSGCPYCSNKRVLAGYNDLQTLFPKLAKEWHPTKNGELKPTDVSPGSCKKVWWIYKYDVPMDYPIESLRGKHFDFEWQAYINNRVSHASGCPYLTGTLWQGFNDLQTTNPELSKEWHPTKNGDLSPAKVIDNYNGKVWWKCPICHFEWEARVSNRNQLKRGCPNCSKQKQRENYRNTRVSNVGSLAITNPALADEWHPYKNGELTPFDVSAGCSDIVWWLYKYDVPDDYPIKSLRGKHFDFEWQATIASRNIGCGCPYLSGKLWSGFNDISVTNPEIIRYWDYSKNSIMPDQVTKGTHRKVWWHGDCGHTWLSSVAAQCRKFSCPICSKEKRTSFPEQAIFYYIRQLFPDAVNGDKDALDGRELDIYIPSKRCGIEYDGSVWHTSASKDRSKDRLCIEKNVRLIRVRESGCDDYDMKVFKSYIYDYGDWTALQSVIRDICSLLTNRSIVVDINKDSQEIQAIYLSQKKDRSVAVNHPELLSLWHPIKNKELTLYQVSSGSEVIGWWLDRYGHEFKCKINEMTSGGEHCPYCSNRELLIGFNDLKSRFPNIADEWDYEKNKVSPSQVLFNKGKYWFKCRSCGNEWQAYLANRTRLGSGCPTCGHKKRVEKRREQEGSRYGQALSVTYPELALEWDEHKNGISASQLVNPSTIKGKYWWKCNTCGYEWDSTIKNRMRHRGCPECSKKRVKVINVETNEVFLSINDAAERYNCSSTSIVNCCRGRIKTCKGYHWRYSDE